MARRTAAPTKASDLRGDGGLPAGQVEGDQIADAPRAQFVCRQLGRSLTPDKTLTTLPIVGKKGGAIPFPIRVS